MARAPVPYSPVPSVAPQGTPLPGQRFDVPGEAFGGGVGKALEGLGGSISHAGDEIFARGLAIQEIQNQNEARDAETEYMTTAGKLHADYNALQGKAAVDAFPKYQKDLAEARTAVRDKMSNDASKRMYDSNSISLMSRSVFNGAGHAANENKQWALGSSKARVAALGDQALAVPDDTDQFKQSLVSTRAEIAQQGALQGWSKEQTEQETAEQVSKLWAKRIDGTARTSPFKAKKMLDDAVKSGELRGEVIGKVTDVVNSKLYTVGARNLSNEINSGRDLYWGSRKVELPQAKAAIGGFESGGNYQAIGVQTKHGRALGKYQVMEEYLPGFLREAGMPAMTPEAFLKDAKAQDQLFEAIFGGYMNKYGSFNEAASRWFTGRSIDEARKHNVADPLGTRVDTYLQRTNAHLAQNMPLADRIARGEARAKELAPDNPLFADYITTRISADFSTDQRVKLNDAYQNRQVIEGALMGDRQGKLPTTMEELRQADPKVENAWPQLDSTTQRRYLGILAKNAKGDYSWTMENLKEYQRLRGMAYSDPAEFMNQDVVGLEMPISARKEFINLQQKLRSKAEQDPRVTKALQVLGPDMFNAGITKAQSKEDFYQFVGALQDALTNWQEETQKPPQAKDIQAIGARLLQERATPWMLNPFSKTPMYRVPVPSAEAEKIKADPFWAEKGITPTDQQIQRVYTRKLFQDLYGGKAKQDAQRPKVPDSK